jgi:hypothetical protein
VDGTDDLWWNGIKEAGHVRSECKEDEGTDCEMETVTLIGKGIYSLTHFIY